MLDVSLVKWSLCSKQNIENYDDDGFKFSNFLKCAGVPF